MRVATVEPRPKVVKMITAIAVVTSVGGESPSASHRLARPYAMAPRSPAHHMTTWERQPMVASPLRRRRQLIAAVIGKTEHARATRHRGITSAT